jgi:hypothetical protein
MTVTVKAMVAKQIEAAQTAQYTAVNVRAVIDKATVTNTTVGNVALSVNLIGMGGTAGDGNVVVKSRTVLPFETLVLHELTGQVLEPGGFISTVAGAAASLTLRISGREVS